MLGRVRFCSWTLSLTCFALSSLTWCEAAAPRLSTVTPRGAQRGTEVELLFQGERFEDAQQIVIYQPGMEVTSLEVVNDKQVKAKVKIAENCTLGTKHFRVRTASGLSDLQSFRVGSLPVVAEVEPNNEFATPQAIGMNVTIDGRITNEDVDYYVVEAKKGDRITAEIEAIRLGDSFFDAYIAILNEARFELSTSDDAALVYQDGIASIVAPEDGKYIVQIRETSYGNGNFYRCHIGHFPRPRAIVPAGGKAGSTVAVKYLGDVAGEIAQDLVIPAEASGEIFAHAQDALGLDPCGIPFRISDLDNVIEQEPNNDPATASAAQAPAAYNGVIGESGDVDFFKFTATKGQVLDIRVYARQIRSELDSVMYVHNLLGGNIAGNDDTGGPDSYIRFNPPADGEYLVSVRDHLGRGGHAFHYRIEAVPVAPRLEASINEFDRYVETRLVVPQGGRLPILIATTRRDFGGPIEYLGENLPAGVTIESATLAADQAVAQVLIAAAADAPLGAALSKLTGKLVDPNQPNTVVIGNTRQDVTMVRGQNNRDFFVEVPPALGLAVSQKAPFSVQIVEPKVPLVQSGVLQLKVVATRDEGFTAPIKVDLLLNPPGVNSSREVSIPEGQTEASITINSAGNAQVNDHKIAIRAKATVGNGPVESGSAFGTLKVAEPYVKLKFQQAAIEQNADSAMVVEVEVVKPFEGDAQVTLMGLPNKVTAPAMTINKETKELIFPLKAEADAPPGMNKNIFCTVVITENGEPITHNIGSGVLRVDKPLPPKADAPVVAQAPVPMPEQKPAEAPKKPLSRLEQLRLEQKQKLEALQNGGAETKTDSQ
ncbi:peptidase [bacterium]|nr:peptidase [bacterium]